MALRPLSLVAMAIVSAMVLIQATTWSAERRSLPANQPPIDWRLGPLKDLDGYFPFQTSESPEAWQQRAAARRRAMQVALGIWPLPTKTPLNAVVHGRREMPGYTIEKVYFESLPGFYVTGNLYRPLQNERVSLKRPCVLCPHGHFDDGRFGAASDRDIRQQIVQGGERFEDSGKNCIQAKCVQLARMGCVVFNYDMIGYCDSQQISFDLAHRFAQQRADMIDPEHWGFFSPQAESNLQSIMGLQTWNSIRALDWISELPDVDPARIAVTGASGGGTQTFVLCALDDRPAIAIPAVMVSTAMQGGCTCENASLLRVGTGNVEFAALMAPRPLCMISANDWTREMAQKGFPELQAHYRMLGAEANVEHHPFLHFGHNYNYVSRGVLYRFLNQKFQLGFEEPIVEEDYPRLDRATMSVWDGDHPSPPSGPEFERRLTASWARDARQQLEQLWPKDRNGMTTFRHTVGGAWDVVIGRRAHDVAPPEWTETARVDRGNHVEILGWLRHTPRDQDLGLATQVESLPLAIVRPKSWNSGPIAIWLSPHGKQGLWRDLGPRPEVAQLLQQGVAVVGVDLSEQGELRSEAGSLTETRRVANPREAAPYTLGYNRSLFAERVHDVLTTIVFAARDTGPTFSAQPRANVWLVGLDGAGPWAAAACAQSDGLIARAAIDTHGFRFQNVMNVRSEDLLPGGAKYLDVPGLLALSAPKPLWIAGENDNSLSLVKATFAAEGATDRLTVAGADVDPHTAAVQWLFGR